MWRIRSHPLLILFLLFAINTVNFFDRQILPAVAEPIRHDWALSDSQLGWLASAFTLLYAAIGIPIGRKSDLSSRKWILCLGLSAWSAFTFVSGLARNFTSLFAARLGVGLAEAVCAPASTSLIGDLFPSEQRGRAMSVFMLGLPVGIALSYAVSSAVAQHYGWRSAFFIAGMPGLFLAIAIAFIHEPRRGTVEKGQAGTERRSGSPYFVILRIPTLWCIIFSGALHNFSLYALGSFLPAFLIRYHRIDVQGAGFLSAIVIGAMGAVGMVVGGGLGDLLLRRAPNARMVVATVAMLLSLPACAFALSLPAGRIWVFVLCLGLSYGLMYTYYPLAYSTLQDIIEPALRGTAMATYFFAMYFLGGAFGPAATGWLSDRLARRAALAANPGNVQLSRIPEQFKSVGLQQAMYIVPVLGLLIVAALAVASNTVRKDTVSLQEWMNGASGHRTA